MPTFGFRDGTAYGVTVHGELVGELTRAVSIRPATTTVLGIYPSAEVVPRNLLRFYVYFSASMSAGYVAEHVRLLDATGIRSRIHCLRSQRSCGTADGGGSRCCWDRLASRGG